MRRAGRVHSGVVVALLSVYYLGKGDSAGKKLSTIKYSTLFHTTRYPRELSYFVALRWTLLNMTLF